MSLQEDLERIALQERELTFPKFDAEIAWELGSILRKYAEARKYPVVIDVRRIGQPLFYTAMQGTTPDNPDWIRRKINVVERFHISSYAVNIQEKIKGKSILESQGLSIRDYATHGGAFPLRVADAGIVGTATVSGLPMRADHELVVEALCTFLKRSYPSLRLAPE
jgi:uncharacterized protein (UPF0303 family)